MVKSGNHHLILRNVRLCILVKKNPKNYFVLYDRVLDTVTPEKDLDVIVDDQLKFHEHTAVAAKKANQILGLIKKSYSSRDPYTIISL